MGLSAARAAIWAGLGFLLGFAQTPTLLQPREVEVTGLRVEGASYVDPVAIKIASGLYLSQKLRIPSDDLSNAIRKLWKQGLFSEVEILADSLTEKKFGL